MSDGIRAVRNNNPGNIEIGDPWQGLMEPEDMTPEQRKEKRFCVFKSPEWGFRAMAITLITYYDKRKTKTNSKIDTITEVIERWAPPSENRTSAYIKSVDKMHPKMADEKIDLHTYEDMAPLMKAVATVECGGWFFSEDDLEAGLKMAGVKKPVGSVAQDSTVKATTIASAGTATILVSEIVQQLTPAASLAREIATWAPQIAAGFVLVILGIIIYQRYDAWKKAKA